MISGSFRYSYAALLFKCTCLNRFFIIISLGLSIKNEEMSHRGQYGGGSSRPSFQQSDDGFVNVYVDGSSKGNGYSGARAGYGVNFGPDHPM